MAKKIRKAVFPVAGLGTRFLPATKASPKEMLPVVDKPLIQYAVEEAAAAGVTEMIFITGRNKRSIEDHFDKAYELESELAAKGKTALLEAVQAITPKGINCVYIRQAEPLGLGHAVLCARSVVGDEPFSIVAVALPTALYVEVFPLRDLDQILRWGGWTLVALTLLAGVFGAIIGATAVGRLLRPVRRLGFAAQRIAGGELSTRIELTGDPDLDPIAESFNDMAGAVQARVARERRFSGNVSHELRSPITAALGTAELLESRRERLPEREASLVDVLAQQVRRMSQVLVDLLEISRIGSDDPPQWENADLASLSREVLTMRQLPASLVTGDEPVMRTDARRFERILGNLVDNAQNHGGGVVRVLILREESTVSVMVDDAGPGVDPDVRERLFEPFTRGHASHRTAGAGLGLAIALEQAGVLGGTLEAQSSPEGGARFIVRLPLTSEAP